MGESIGVIILAAERVAVSAGLQVPTRINCSPIAPGVTAPCGR